MSIANDPRPQTGRIRSFVRRQGRMTASQQHALMHYWSRYGLCVDDGPCDWEGLFPASSRRVLEIGFGMGEALLEMASDSPDTAYVGIEVHRPGVGRVLGELHHNDLKNIRVYSADAIQVLESCIEVDSLDAVLLYFPDPWPKKRHHKRRLVQPALVRIISKVLRRGGQFHLASDWEPYAEHMMEVLSACPELLNSFGAGNYCPPPAPRPLTRFERRGLRLDHVVRDLIFERR